MEEYNEWKREYGFYDKSALKRTKNGVVLCALATGLKPGAVFVGI